MHKSTEVEHKLQLGEGVTSPIVYISVTSRNTVKLKVACNFLNYFN